MSTVAPFALVRVATLPFDALTELRPPRLGKLCDELVAARAVQARVRGTLVDALHAAVPRATDVRVRRALIELKRAVHNQRPCKVRADDLAGVRACVDAVADLDAYLAAQATIDAALSGAGSALAQDAIDHVRPRLHALAADPSLDHPLSLASPELWRSLRREAARPGTSAASSKAERSLLGYLVRAAAKANPFSTFAWIGNVEVHQREPAAPSVDGIPRWVRSALNRATVDRLERVAHASPQPALLLRRNPAFRLIDGERVEVVVGVESSRDGRPFRQPIRRVFRTPAAIGRALAEAPDTLTAPALIDALCTVGGVDLATAGALVTRFLDAGVFAPVARSDAFTESPAPIVASSLASGSPVLAERLTEMATTANQVASAGPAQRIVLVERLRELEEATLAATRPHDRSVLRNAVFETAGFTTRCGAIGAPLAQEIANAGTVLRDLVRLDPNYIALRDAFVASFGRGGTCDDALGFLHQAADRMVPPTGPAPSPELAASFPAPVTLAFQIAARDGEAAARGDAQVIVNRIYPGIGWVTARHALGSMPGHAALRDDMKRWLCEAMAPAEPLDVPLCGHANDLQAHPRLTERVLEWPSEPLCAETPGVVRARDLRIVHDPATDRLALEDARGCRLAPISLGSMLPQPAMGAYYLLWRIGTPHMVTSPGVVPPADPDATFEHRPRRSVGRVVVGREAWWISSRWLSERILARNGADRALAAAEELGALGVPATFFARPYLAMSSPLMFDSMRKPIWIDSRNPFFLDLLAPVVESTTWTVLTETLPGPGQVWTRLDGNDHVAELHTELILH